MPPKHFILAVLCLFPWTTSKAQFYTELFSSNQQIYQASAKNGSNEMNINNQFVNLMLPIVRKNQDVFVFRGAYERLNVVTPSGSQYLSSLALPMGYNWTSRKNSNWKYLVLGQAKLAGTWEQNAQWKDQIQLGGVFLATKTVRPDLRWKMGLFVNREAFGPFVIPLFGWDWRINDRWKWIALLPNMMKLEYTAIPNAVNVGLAYRSYTRSFYNSPDQGYIRYNEMQFKSYLEYHFKNYYAFVEGGYFLGKSPRYFASTDTKASTENGLYFNTKPFFLMNFGVAFRLPQ